ncbi:MAG: hypothetical protein ACKVX7_12975 [Planctomycetota bacterium]
MPVRARQRRALDRLLYSAVICGAIACVSCRGVAPKDGQHALAADEPSFAELATWGAARPVPRSGLIGSDSLPYIPVILAGRIAVDYVGYDSRNVRDSGVRVDVIEPQLHVGSMTEPLELRVIGDVRGLDSRFGFKEAWASYANDTLIRASAGLLRIPLGVEHSFDEATMPFVGYSFPAWLTGRTDWGLRVDGEIGTGIFSYDFTAAAGEGFDLNGERLGHPQLALRLVSYPLRGVAPSPPLGGIFLSAARSYAPEFAGQLDIATPLRNKVFLVPRLSGDEAAFWHVGYGVDAGALRFTHEAVYGGIRGLDLPTGGEANLSNQIGSWAATLSWMVTGEPYDSRPFRQRYGRWSPATHPLEVEQLPRDAAAEFPARAATDGGLGAIELALRYANADIDRRFFNLGITDYTQSAQEFRTMTGAANWYLSRYVRVSAEVVRTIADQFPAAFDSHGRDTSFLLRFQLLW